MSKIRVTDEDVYDAFYRVCREATQVEGAYVALVEETPYYGGPEEGGWWGTDRTVVAYQYYHTRAAAEAAAAAVRRMAVELNRQARAEHGRGCQAQLDWCEARGIDDANLVYGEVDGPTSFKVLVTDELPEHVRGSRHWDGD